MTHCTINRRVRREPDIKIEKHILNHIVAQLGYLPRFSTIDNAKELIAIAKYDMKYSN